MTDFLEGLKYFTLAVLRVMLGIVVLALCVASIGLMIFGVVVTGQTENPTWLLTTLLGLFLTAVFGVLLSEIVFG